MSTEAQFVSYELINNVTLFSFRRTSCTAVLATDGIRAGLTRAENCAAAHIRRT
jgi:hypothetical protein